MFIDILNEGRENLTCRQFFELYGKQEGSIDKELMKLKNWCYQ